MTLQYGGNSEQVQTGLQRFLARYPGSTPVIGTSKSLTTAAILAFTSADVVLLARNATVFPLALVIPKIRRAA